MQSGELTLFCALNKGQAEIQQIRLPTTTIAAAHMEICYDYTALKGALLLPVSQAKHIKYLIIGIDANIYAF